MSSLTKTKNWYTINNDNYYCYHDFFDTIMKFKSSKQREAILEVLNTANHHFTVDEIYTIVKEKSPRISLATVYRNLEQLYRMGKIGKIESAGSPVRYDCKPTKHFHIKCVRCGQIEDVVLEEKLEDKIDFEAVARDFTVTGYRIDFYGLCPKCKSGAAVPGKDLPGKVREKTDEQ